MHAGTDILIYGHPILKSVFLSTGKNFGGTKMAVKIDKNTCIGCGACVETCPVQALSLVDGKADVDPGTCVDCGACVAVCPVQALSL